MSRARLFAGRRGGEGNVVPLSADHRASELVADIAGGADGQAQLLGSFGPHLVVPGAYAAPRGGGPVAARPPQFDLQELADSSDRWPGGTPELDLIAMVLTSSDS
jgi:hypothetical protein